MSRRDDDFDLRVFRVGGRQPTARDKWRALYRLWRIARGRGMWQDMAVDLCFRVLFPNRVLSLLDAPPDSLAGRSRLPKFLRRRLLDYYRRRRLYGNHPEWAAQDKVVAQRCAAEGLEVTPTEVAEARWKVIQIVRDQAAKTGECLPADDADLLRQLWGRS